MTTPATAAGYQVAIARNSGLPHIFPHVHPDAAAARSQASAWIAEDDQLGGRKTGDFVVIPALADPRAYVSSADVRALARTLPDHLAPAAEQMYFLGAPTAHVVQYQDRQLEQRRAAEMRAIARRQPGRRL